MRRLLPLLLLAACAPEPAEEPEPFPGDPAGLGAWSVESSDHEVATADDVVDATLYEPTGEGPWTGAPPVIVLMPGFASSHTQWDDWSQRLASWGFVVAAFTFSANSFDAPADHERDAREVSAVLDWLEGRGVDTAAVATAGHSKGGKIAFFSAVLDDRIDAVVGFDPVDAGGAPCFIDPKACHNWSVAPDSFDGDAGMMDGLAVPTLIFAAPPGPANPEEHHASLFFGGASSPSTYVLHPEGLHADWPDAYAVGDIDRPMTVAFLAQELWGATGAEPWLAGEWLDQKVELGFVEVQSK
jgi:dienelactone hydrolase